MSIKLEETKDKDFYVEWTSAHEFKFLSKKSINTSPTNMANFIDGIKGYGKIISNKNGVLDIELTTKIRIELKILIGLFVLIFLAVLLNDGKIQRTLIFFSIMIIGSGFFFRIQEDELFFSFKTHLTTV